jgi:hypothetical protein
VDNISSFQGEDERWLRNYNIHSMEKQVNISCSYNPRNGLCYTCFGEPHAARGGREGQPVTYVLSDQSFPANVPATDGGECFRIVRVEDGTVQEITNAFLELNGGRKMEPGTIIMLGSLTKLGTVGTPFYALEWSKCRCRLMEELGDVIVVPHLPLLVASMGGRHLVRSLVEFLDWYDDQQEAETGILRSLRREYVESFLKPASSAAGWADELQNLMMPVSLYSDGLTLYKSRGWGDLPQQLRRVDEKEETLWIEKLAAALNRELRLSLATGVASGRTLSAVRAQEEVGGRLEYKVAGASNAARTAAALARRGEIAEKVGQLGWSLAIEKDTDGLIEQLGNDSNEHTVLVFHCMDNGSFFSMNKTGGSSLPRKDKKDKIYHIEGKLVVANGYSLELMTDQMGRIVNKVKPGLAVIVTPMPRYLDPCCEAHLGGRTEEQLDADRLKLIKAVWNLKRETFQLVAKNHMRNVIVVSPMEVLGIKDSVEEVRKVMPDGIHMSESAIGRVVENIVQKAEEFFTAKKRGPTEKAGPPEKKARMASSGGRIGRGGWMGGRGGGPGGRGGGGYGLGPGRSYSTY